jgi:hypothetical protein
VHVGRERDEAEFSEHSSRLHGVLVQTHASVDDEHSGFAAAATVIQ